jgi:hypothetical protein
LKASEVLVARSQRERRFILAENGNRKILPLANTRLI